MKGRVCRIILAAVVCASLSAPGKSENIREEIQVRLKSLRRKSVKQLQTFEGVHLLMGRNTDPEAIAIPSTVLFQDKTSLKKSAAPILNAIAALGYSLSHAEILIAPAAGLNISQAKAISDYLVASGISPVRVKEVDIDRVHIPHAVEGPNLLVLLFRYNQPLDLAKGLSKEDGGPVSSLGVLPEAFNPEKEEGVIIEFSVQDPPAGLASWKYQLQQRAPSLESESLPVQEVIGRSSVFHSIYWNGRKNQRGESYQAGCYEVSLTVTDAQNQERIVRKWIRLIGGLSSGDVGQCDEQETPDARHKELTASKEDDSGEDEPATKAGGSSHDGALSREEMQSMMDRAAKKAVAAQKNFEPITIRSDVDKPRYRTSENPNNFAVVIGVEKYSNDLPDAQFAERDAQAVKDHLIALGYPERNIKFLTGNRASKSNLEAYIEDWLPRNVKENGRVFFYFSGHGAPDPNSNQAYLVPSDGNPNFLEKTAYPVKKLYASLNALKAKSVIVALDSCFSGTGGRSVLAEGVRPLVAQVDASIGRGGKIVLFAAASSKEITSTLKDQGHGIFTYYFLKGLEGGAKDASGAITTRGLYEFLKPQVQDAASRQNRDQTPVLEESASRELLRFR